MGELTSLIGDLVDMARQEEKQPEPIEVRLDAIVGRAVERAKRRAPGLRFEISMDAGSVKGQPALLERAVLNVLDNAAKWSPVGGTVEVTLRRGETWTLDVRDRGPGISAADLPYVFDRFYRAANARSMPGSGLGLAIVHQVISNHGGTVALSVPPDGGTLVHIELPIVVEAEMEEPTPGGGLAGAGPVPATTVVGEHPFLLVEVPTTDAALVETRPEPPSFLLPTGPTLIAAEDPSSAEGHEVSGASDDASPSPSSPPVEAGPPASAAPDDRPVPVPGAPSAAPPPGEDHVPAPARSALFPNFS